MTAPGAGHALLHALRMREGIDPADYATTVDVLRRVVANLGGNGDLPSSPCR